MPATDHPDHEHLLVHARQLFPSATIFVTYEDDEIIHVEVDQVRYTFEIGSDDDEYLFSNGQTWMLRLQTRAHGLN